MASSVIITIYVVTKRAKFCARCISDACVLHCYILSDVVLTCQDCIALSQVYFLCCVALLTEQYEVTCGGCRGICFVTGGSQHLHSQAFQSAA